MKRVHTLLPALLFWAVHVLPNSNLIGRLDQDLSISLCYGKDGKGKERERRRRRRGGGGTITGRTLGMCRHEEEVGEGSPLHKDGRSLVV